jgi:hypothetical protein
LGAVTLGDPHIPDYHRVLLYATRKFEGYSTTWH